MVKLVDMPDLGSGAARRVGSSPIIRTKSPNESLDFFCGQKGREVYAERSRSKSYYPHKKFKREFGLFLFLEAKGLGIFVNLFPAFHYIFFTILFKKTIL